RVCSDSNARSDERGYAMSATMQQRSCSERVETRIVSIEAWLELLLQNPSTRLLYRVSKAADTLPRYPAKWKFPLLRTGSSTCPRRAGHGSGYEPSMRWKISIGWKRCSRSSKRSSNAMGIAWRRKDRPDDSSSSNGRDPGAPLVAAEQK